MIYLNEERSDMVLCSDGIIYIDSVCCLLDYGRIVNNVGHVDISSYHSVHSLACIATLLFRTFSLSSKGNFPQILDWLTIRTDSLST